MRLVVFLFLVGFALACSNREEMALPGMDVETVHAYSLTNLKGRDDWKLMVYNREYNYIREGDSLFATGPKNKPYRFTEEEMGAVDIHFYSSDYWGGSRSVGPVYPNIIDQSTGEKLLSADLLTGRYVGKVMADLSGISLRHTNALLLFQIQQFPMGAKIDIVSKNGFSIRPLASLGEGMADTIYNAILIPQDQPIIRMRTRDTVFYCMLATDPLVGNTRYTFMPFFDGEKLVNDCIDMTNWTTGKPGGGEEHSRPVIGVGTVRLKCAMSAAYIAMYQEGDLNSHNLRQGKDGFYIWTGELTSRKISRVEVYDKNGEKAVLMLDYTIDPTLQTIDLPLELDENGVVVEEAL